MVLLPKVLADTLHQTKIMGFPIMSFPRSRSGKSLTCAFVNTLASGGTERRVRRSREADRTLTSVETPGNLGSRSRGGLWVLEPHGHSPPTDAIMHGEVGGCDTAPLCGAMARCAKRSTSGLMSPAVMKRTRRLLFHDTYIVGSQTPNA